MRSAMGSGQSFAMIGAVGLALAGWLQFDATNAVEPMSLALTPDDMVQYLNGWPSGTGVRETAGFLNKIAVRADRPILVLAGGFGCHGLWTLPMLTKTAKNLEYRSFPITNRSQLRQAIAESSQRTVVIVSERTNCELPTELVTAVQPALQPVFSFDRPDSPADIDVYQLESSLMIRPDQVAPLPQFGPDEEARIVAVDNPNGLEKMGADDFFWMGKASTILRIASATGGKVTLEGIFHFGPSFGETVRYQVRSTAGGGFELPIGSGKGSFDVNVDAGWSEIVLTPIDRPRNSQSANGDRRPLMTGVQGLRIGKFTPAAVPSSGCEFGFGEGWQALEKGADSWLRWNSGTGVLWITVATAQSVKFVAEVGSLPIPNRVRLELNQRLVSETEIDGKAAAQVPLGPVELQLRPGRNRLDIISQKPAGQAPNDTRPLAVAIRNAKVETASPTGCSIRF